MLFCIIGEMKNKGIKNFFIPFILFVVGFIFGLGVSSLTSMSGNEHAVKSDLGDFKNTTYAHPNMVTVEGQDAGNMIFISLVSLSRGAWVAIHEDTGGEPGNILGARYFLGGKTAGTVELLRGTLPGNVYYVIVHEDDGDREFDFRNDAPLQDPFGNYIMAEFRTLRAK